MTALGKYALLIFLLDVPVFAGTRHYSCPDTHPWTGHVINYSFGFEFDVPKPLKAYWNSARCVQDGNDCTCMGDHGRDIPLAPPSSGPDRVITLFAGYDMTADVEMAQEGRDQSKPETLGGAAVAGSVKRSVGWVVVAGRKTKLTSTHYVDSKTDLPVVTMAFQLLRSVKGDGLEYDVSLSTDPEHQVADTRKFRSVLSSFRYTHLNW
jgi:hypothetical protein